MTTSNPGTAGRGWAYTGAILGGLVSVAANVAHSYVPPTGAPTTWQPPLGAVIGAVFWPIFLFIAVEILARTRWPTGLRWTLLRHGGLLPVALVAAVVSYRHLTGLLRFYGEDPLTATIGPLAVDGLMVMATGALIATTRPRTTPPPTPTGQPDHHHHDQDQVDTDPAPVRTGPASAGTFEQSSPAGTVTPAASNGPTVPTHLLPTARYAAMNHQQTTGQPITADQLATRINVAPGIARQLLDAITEPAPARINGVPATAPITR